MLVAKQVADLITYARASLIILFIWLGFSQGNQGLSIAGWLLIFSWTSDAIDGPIARRSRVKYHTWIGDHDLQVDMAVSLGLLIYMVLSGFISVPIFIIYILVWTVIFWRWDVLRPLGMLCQAPIYLFFIIISMYYSSSQGIALIVWILCVLILTWPRFPKEVVPGFLEGMRGIIQRGNKS